MKKKVVSLLPQKYKDLDQTSAFHQLIKINPTKIDLKKLLTPERIAQYRIENGPLTLSYATSLVTDEVLKLFQKLATEEKVIERYQDLLSGKIMNPSEKRKVLHHMTRSDTDRGIYGEEQKKIAEFARKVHTGEIVGATGKRITDVVQIGIGGSDLGPRALYKSLKNYVEFKKGELPIKAHFISNVDPDDANHLLLGKKHESRNFGIGRILDKLDIERTLFIVVSKSGTTQETLTNLKFVQEKAKEKGLKEEDLKKHFIAVTGKGSPMDNPAKYLASFYIDDNIGGRYSATSAVGGTVLSLAFGPEIFEELLQGAHEMDKASLDKDIHKNAALMDALIGIWERVKLGIPVKGIIPYSKALQIFPSHLQQLDCESNGKSVSLASKKVHYQTGPMIFGVPGTDAQHSFFQKIHQGTDKIPIEFITFKKPQIEKDLTYKDSTSQTKLHANLAAQMIALAKGKDSKNPNDVFSGNRPTRLVFADQLTPKTLGALLAYFENLVMFQGFLFNINSFDQPGVELGKLLTNEILKKDGAQDPALKKLYSLLV